MNQGSGKIIRDRAQLRRRECAGLYAVLLQHVADALAQHVGAGAAVRLALEREPFVQAPLLVAGAEILVQLWLS